MCEIGKMMQLSVSRTYRDFVSLVAKGRNLPEKRVTELAQGRVYTGRQAVERGLADSLGGMMTAVGVARTLAKAPEADIMWFEKKQGRLSMLFSELFARAASVVGLESLVNGKAAGLVPAPLSSAALLQEPARQASRLLQLVKTPESVYAHCLCGRPPI